jgi:DNA-binding transcriptional regulator YhcF (GntR family)
MQEDRQRLLPYFFASSARSVHDTIVGELIILARGDTLKEGDTLPGSPALAKHMGVSPVSVERCYNELHRIGALSTDRRRGTCLASKRKLFEAHARKVILGSIFACRTMRFTKSEIKRMFDEGLTAEFSTHPRSQGSRRKK